MNEKKFYVVIETYHNYEIDDRKVVFVSDDEAFVENWVNEANKKRAWKTSYDFEEAEYRIKEA